MGLGRAIRRTVLTAAAVSAAGVAYLGSTTTMICPLPADDPIWTSDVYRKYNRHRNATNQDVVVKRIPLDRIRPELLERPGDLATEFCRGVWSGWGYEIQRRYLANKYQGPATANQLWTRAQLASSAYEVGTQITDHFEVVDKTDDAITVRCGDSPRRPQPRESDGLFVISAEVDREKGEAVLGLKSCFFSSAARVEGIVGPMPVWMEVLHGWYSRLWMVSGCRRVMR